MHRSAAITLDDEELAEAHRFTRAEPAAPDLDIALPHRDSIPRRLIDHWVASG
ncbi:MAG: hypothetical protein GDA49_07395 [Rhodospirillales bacterium]|nr:hypothetical protein [Rhodospirillales bacterium]